MSATPSATTLESTKILVERRFPLDLSQSIDSIRELYEAAKRSRWDPLRDIAWDEFQGASLDAPLRDAARAVWSRRAWIEYTGLAETPALLIRFCIEADREADPKYFLAVRNTEEAWHIECFHRLAEMFGGYLDRPENPAWEPVINQTLYRKALDADRSLDAYVAVHCAVEDGLEMELYELYARQTRDPVVSAILERVLAAKKRNASFGWLYLESRLRTASAELRTSIANAISAWIETVAFAGYHIPTLSEQIEAAADASALALVVESGMGAATPAAEEQTFIDYLARARRRLAELGIALQLRPHDRLGAV